MALARVQNHRSVDELAGLVGAADADLAATTSWLVGLGATAARPSALRDTVTATFPLAAGDQWATGVPTAPAGLRLDYVMRRDPTPAVRPIAIALLPCPQNPPPARVSAAAVAAVTGQGSGIVDALPAVPARHRDGGAGPSRALKSAQRGGCALENGAMPWGSRPCWFWPLMPPVWWLGWLGCTVR